MHGRWRRLGYGAEYLDDDVVDVPPLPAPPVNLMTARALMDQSPEIYDAPEPEGDQEAEDSEQGSDDDDRAGEPSIQPDSTVADDTPAGADISWTKFWEWAKPRGYGSAIELGELLNSRRLISHAGRSSTHDQAVRA